MRKIYFYIKYLFSFIIYLLFNGSSQFKKNNNNEEIIILGNGPSFIKSIDHKFFFKGKKIMGLNSFVKTESFDILKPDYYIVSDDAYWLDDNSTNSKNKYHDINMKRRQLDKNNFVGNIIKKVNWKLILFFPLHAKGSETINFILKNNKNITVTYYVMNPINFKIKQIRHFLYKFNFGMPTVQTVLIAAIFTALNMNFKKIYLVGGDHTWHEDFFINHQNILFSKNKHFYDDGFELIPLMSDGKNHSKIHEEFYSLYKAFKGHILLEEYSKYLNAKIFNASEVSYIDAYERFTISKK